MTSINQKSLQPTIKYYIVKQNVFACFVKAEKAQAAVPHLHTHYEYCSHISYIMCVPGRLHPESSRPGLVSVWGCRWDRGGAGILFPLTRYGGLDHI